ncbi:hypothetical protein [Corynebacterium sp.]|uniref:hypothetical protein n=1 Tax=Corynebacterium sp. TaxID=1720 RepID=UPI0026DC44F6|nr:hypothetical protein [Corynebacterium sp.]MDO5031505.1 hypothetical protein [Corynebacterium sp.]
MDTAPFLSHSPLPQVTRERVLSALNGPELDMAAVAHPEDAEAAVARLNELDWVISTADSVVKVDCVLPTELPFEDLAPVMCVLSNEYNAGAFDGRALVGNVDGLIELRGDACFVTAAGMNDDQLFHALNLAIIAAQDALLATIDRFNEAARGL